MDIMVSATSGLNGICLTESWRQIRIVARQSMGKLAFGTASSLSGFIPPSNELMKLSYVGFTSSPIKFAYANPMS